MPPRRSALPQPSDSDWHRPKPRHPIVGPASYPKSQPDVISAPGLFRKMDPEALFFAFYYQPDTYQQYLAAQVRRLMGWGRLTGCLRRSTTNQLNN